MALLRLRSWLFLFTASAVLGACGDGESKGVEAASTEVGGSDDVGDATEGTATDTSRTTGEDTDDGECTPEDECQTDDDCVEGQSCISNCTCFGETNHCEPAEAEYSDCLSDPELSCHCLTAAEAGVKLAGVCFFECEKACECPEAPEGITVVCDDALKAGGFPGSVCLLDCSGGKPCPDDMICIAESFCMHPAMETEEPQYFLECGDEAANCNEGEVCLQSSDEDTDWGVCSVAGCDDARDCPSPPAGGTAVVACDDLGRGNICYIDCSNGEECPTSMTCSPDGNCAFESPVSENDSGAPNELSLMCIERDEARVADHRAPT